MSVLQPGKHTVALSTCGTWNQPLETFMALEEMEASVPSASQVLGRMLRPGLDIIPPKGIHFHDDHCVLIPVDPMLPDRQTDQHQVLLHPTCIFQVALSEVTFLSPLALGWRKESQKDAQPR